MAPPPDDGRPGSSAPPGGAKGEPGSEPSVPVRLVTRSGGVPRVLVVDDDPLVRNVVQRTLERAGADVTVVAAGEHALELVREHRLRFDVALVDTSMPGMNGVDALRAMRRLDGGLRAALMSGLDLERGRADQLAAGAEAVLMKPFTPRVLFDTIARLLSE